MYAIADIIVQPAINLLTAAVNGLKGVNLLASQGLSDPGFWLGPITYLGPGWEALLASVLTGAAIVTAVGAAKAAYGLYLQLKAGVKWW